LRARLVRARDDSAYPFVVVHEGRFARILLAELVGADGQALTQFAWKLRVDSVAGSVSPGGEGPSNVELDRIWQQERAELLRVHSPNVVAPIAVPPALTQSPPVFFCRRIDSYFHPVHPHTGGLLVVCRDDARLAAAGLPPYGQDTIRYLYDASAGPASPGPASHGAEGSSSETFYRIDGEPTATASARIETKAELIRGWARIAHGEQPSPDLPCQTCDHRSECYASGQTSVVAEQHLHLVSFYNVDSLAVQLAATDFDTAIMRLSAGLPDSGRSRAWVSGLDRRQRVLEVVRLKLAAFVDVCRGVRDLHSSGRPHLGVSPANIVAFEDMGSSALPSNWRLRFALTDLGGAIPVQVPGIGAGETLWQPGREVSEDETSRLFLAPALRSLEGGSVTMSVTCRAVVDDAGGTKTVMDVHRAGVPAFVLPGDLLIVQPVADGAVASARVDEVGARGLSATVLPTVAAQSSEDIASTWAETTFDARLSFVRRSSPSADLYALGMLLLRMLLVHDEQTLPEVATTVEHCLQLMVGKVAVDDANSLADRWQEILDGDDGEGRFSSWHVMYQRADRQQVFDAELKGDAVIPKDIWQSLMGLAGKLLLASPVARGDEMGVAGRPMAALLLELERVERQLQVELFEREARDEAIAMVCGQRLVALRAGLSEVPVKPEEIQTDAMISPLPGAPSAAGQAAVVEQTEVEQTAVVDSDAARATGFVLAVGRVGESAIHQHHFSQNRVTIGRREGDNLLVLGDPMVSSKHAVIELCDGEFVLFDCGSTNGTEVDGIRLPIEVPHPLDDGSVIHIRPFMLSFRSGVAEPTHAGMVPVLSVDEVRQQLCSTYAEFAGHGAQELHAELFAALDSLSASLGRRGLLASLEALQKKAAKSAGTSAPVPASSSPEVAAPSDPLAEAALRALRQVARSLTENTELDSVAEVQEFAGRMQRFVDVTTQWIEEMLEWRRVFSKQIDLRVTQAGAARPPLRTAAEVCEELLAPTGGPDGAAMSDYFLSRFYDDVMAILEGLLQGNQRMRNAVRDQLDPAKLVAEAGREAKLGILVQAASGSALWKLYTAAFEAVTAGQGHEAELQRLLSLAAERRANRS
jgi:predicted component of type VI protein secretion system